MHTGYMLGECLTCAGLGTRYSPPPLTTLYIFSLEEGLGKVLFVRVTANRFEIQINHMNFSLLAVPGRLICPLALRAEEATLA